MAPALVDCTAVRTAIFLALALGCSSKASGPSPGTPPVPAVAAAGELLAPSAFAAITDPTKRSQALFVEASRVLLHPRCVNCHPPDDTPRQGDAHAFHDPPVARGPSDRGVVAMKCGSCHQDRNVELARVPGAPDWHLAPASMAWLGKSPAAICAQISDPARNGGKTLAQVHHHIGHDALVAWGFSPGGGRARPPGSQAQLAALLEAWIASGAACPQEEVAK